MRHLIDFNFYQNYRQRYIVHCDSHYHRQRSLPQKPFLVRIVATILFNKSHPGAIIDLGNRMKILFNMFSIFYLWEHTQRVWYKNLWNWHVNNIWPFCLTLGWKCYLHSILLVIPVNLICHMTMFENKKIDTLGTPGPQSPTPGAWPRRQNKNPVWYVFYLSFVRTHTKFGIKIFEIDMVTII